MYSLETFFILRTLIIFGAFFIGKTFSTKLINKSLAHTVVRFMRVKKDEKSQSMSSAN